MLREYSYFGVFSNMTYDNQKHFIAIYAYQGWKTMFKKI